MSLVEEKSAFPVGKFVVFLARVGQGGATAFDILLSAAHPSAFCRGQYVGIDVVFAHDVLFGGDVAVVPHGADGASHFGGAALLVVDVALVDAHHVGKEVEVVDVVIAAVDVGNARDGTSARGPHLRHVAIRGRGRTADELVPANHLFPLRFQVIAERLQEVRVGDGHLVATDVDIGRTRKGVGHLREDVFQFLNALVGLHRVAHRPLESSAVAGHVDFGNDGDAVFVGQVLQFAALFLCVVFSCKARHRRCCRQLRVLLHFKPPALILGQVHVEGVDFEARHQLDLLFQLLEGDVAAADVVHKPAQLEGWPVGNRTAFQHRLAVVALGHLCERLHGTKHSELSGSLDGDALCAHRQLIGFVGIVGERVVERARDGSRDERDGDGRGIVRHLHVHEVLKRCHHALFSGRCRHEAHASREAERACATLSHLLWLRQNVFDFCIAYVRRGQPDGGNDKQENSFTHDSTSFFD